ncbi:MAG: RDD family protein [Acidobacteriota bacterium]|nr:RDD family protein [Acidobacteriota bacterium]
MNPSIFCNRCGAQNTPSAQFCSQCGALLAGISPAIPQIGAGQIPNYQPANPPAWTSQNLNHQYGGFWIRVVAAIIDGLLVNVVVAPIAFLIAATIGFAGLAVSMPGRGIHLVSAIVGGALGFVGSWLYEAVMLSSSRQATLGKMAVSLKVTDLAGNRFSFERATGRHFAKYISGATLGIGYIMAAFTDRHQALHDMIAGTLVRRVGLR